MSVFGYAVGRRDRKLTGNTDVARAGAQPRGWRAGMPSRTGASRDAAGAPAGAWTVGAGAGAAGGAPGGSAPGGGVAAAASQASPARVRRTDSGAASDSR